MKAGYEGGYDQVKRHVREVRPKPPPEPVRRFETSPGHLGQVDFAEFKTPCSASICSRLIEGWKGALSWWVRIPSSNCRSSFRVEEGWR